MAGKTAVVGLVYRQTPVVCGGGGVSIVQLCDRFYEYSQSAAAEAPLRSQAPKLGEAKSGACQGNYRKTKRWPCSGLARCVRTGESST